MTKIYDTAPFTVIVANFSGQKDAKGNPVNLRSGFKIQNFVASNGNFIGLLGDTPPAPSTGEVTVSDNNFATGEARLLIGDMLYISGVHFTQGGSAALTADAIVDAINYNTPQTKVSASNVGNVITVNGPTGPFGNLDFRDLYTGTVKNFTLNPDDGELTTGDPKLVAPEIL
jgi:hypothetical protein